MLVHWFFGGVADCAQMWFYLQEENVVAIRTCARFPGWKLHAHSPRLVVRISNKGMHAFYLTV